MTAIYNPLRLGDSVYILINPHGFTANNIFGVVERILPDAAFGGGDLYMVRYPDPIDGVDRVHPFRDRFLAPNDPRFLKDMLVRHEEIVKRLRRMLEVHQRATCWDSS